MKSMESKEHWPKIVFIEKSSLSDGRFVRPIVDCLKNKYNVKLLRTLNGQDVMKAVDWADIVWLEWANELAIHATNNLPQLKDKKVICRLHGYELFSDMPAKINWNVVDTLIFVASHKQKMFFDKFKNIDVDFTVIRNGIPIENYSIQPDKVNTKKLVLLGNLNFRKGVPILLQFYKQLLKHDSSYRLYIRGIFQDERLKMATKTMIDELSLKDKIEFVDWVDNLNSWFADKSHILSFSLEESFHYAIGEGMAAGLKPVIHAWNESREIWPNEFIFRDLDEFLDLILDSTYDPKRYRHSIVDQQLDFKTQMDKISQILER